MLLWLLKIAECTVNLIPLNQNVKAIALSLRLQWRMIISVAHLPHRPGCRSTSPWHTLPLWSVYRFLHHNTSFYSPGTENNKWFYPIDAEKKKFHRNKFHP